MSLHFIAKALYEIITAPLHTYKNITKTLNAQFALPQFEPHPWLHLPFAQCLAGELHRNYKAMNKKTRGELHVLIADDGQEIHLNILNRYAPQPKAIAFLTHGVSGSCESMAPWYEYAIENDLVVVVYTRRWHQTSKPTAIQPPPSPTATPRLPSHADIQDCALTMTYVNATYPNIPIIGIGYSAGGPHLVKYAYHTEETTTTTLPKFEALAIVSCASDFSATAQYFDSPKGMPTNMMLREQLKRIYDENPNLPIETKQAIKYTRTFTELDRVLAPARGYKTVDDFYLDTSPLPVLYKLKTPLLYIVSEDDPMLFPKAYDDIKHVCDANPGITGIFTSKGGHLGWLDKNLTSWVDQVILKYIKHTVPSKHKTRLACQ